jgi:hypothetical protein
VLLAVLAVAGDTTVFGPRTYNGTGRPVLSRQAFTVAHGGSGYTLRVTNHGVFTALILANGRIVVRPVDYRDPPDRPEGDDDRWEPHGNRMQRDWRADDNGHTKSLIEKPLTLRNGTNEILVVFISRAGASFTVDHGPRGDAVRVIS